MHPKVWLSGVRKYWRAVGSSGEPELDRRLTDHFVVLGVLVVRSRQLRIKI